MQALNSFINHWQDLSSKERLLRSSKSKEVQKAEVENLLKNIAMRFERSPNPNTIKLWASDIVDAGFNESMVEQACKSIPFKFEKHPTLAQIMELLRPYLPQIDLSESELDKYTRLAIPHLKAKLVNMVGEDGLQKLINYYRANAFNCTFSIEVAVLGDWCRCYLGKPEKIIEQAKISNEKALQNDEDYFIRPLKQYCESNKLL